MNKFVTFLHNLYSFSLSLHAYKIIKPRVKIKIKNEKHPQNILLHVNSVQVEIKILDLDAPI